MLFGSVVVYYKNVQDKIINKYDQWHKEIINKFGLTFEQKLRDFNQKIF